MQSIEQLFKWQQAIDNNDTTFVPSNVKDLVGNKFIIVNLINNAIFLVNEIVTLTSGYTAESADEEFTNTYPFKQDNQEEVLWWCEVMPYKEEI